ncbi:MAG: preprotein translocase subunit SecE [Clostridia bacterium]|nr:preprotein translocase subunit SecE [Clostridia bacterium]
MAENEKVTVSTEAKAVETKKADKKKEKKPGLFAKIVKWFRDLKSEAKKVVWPTGKQVVNNTIIVIIAAIVVCLFVALLDFVFGAARDLIATIF